jgi:ferredoxin
MDVDVLIGSLWRNMLLSGHGTSRVALVKKAQRPNRRVCWMRVIANLNLCQGHARCEDLCPEVFSTDAVEGKVVIEQSEFPPELEEKVRMAVRNCPEGALRIAKGVSA